MLRNVYAENRTYIVGTYLLMGFEFALYAVLPWVLGLAVDSLLAGHREEFWWYLGLSLVGMVVSTTRRRIDTRVFRRVWKDKTIDAVHQQRKKGVKGPRIVSRCQMVLHYGDFFEFTVPAFVNALLAMVVSAVMIVYVMEWMSVWIMLMTLLSIVVSYLLSLYVKWNEAECQKNREQRDARITHEDFSEVEGDYEKLRRLYVFRSDADASAWRLIELLHIGATVLALLYLCQHGGTAGAIMATLMYVNKLFDHVTVFSCFFNSVSMVQVANEVLNKE